MYFRDAMGAVYVYDVTSKESFDGIVKWVKETDKMANRDVVKILIGNKADLVST
jgi:GTPase SAR1 family protein